MGALVFTPSSFTLDKDLLRVPRAGPSNFGYRIIFTFFWGGGGGGRGKNTFLGGGGGGGVRWKITFLWGRVVTRPQPL